ncbi:MAG: UDP-N-acetylmuramyl-tripeptide synthetase [Candidatus Paceibacterota bacterium]|jgi:UDP-N-acetylmuramoyl-L-alanyl-D-glutamate--2,6-diaminopimelate ligase
MLDKILHWLKKFIPRQLFVAVQPLYHYLLAWLGAIIYRFPARQLKIIFVTGTKGKTSTTEILSAILTTAGHKVASTSTLQFKIGDKIERNLYKMSMPGRMFMQKFLRRAVSAGCDFAVIEGTSEGSKLFRHKFIDLDGLIFTNISPEHIESHGSFEKYLEAKLEYARALDQSKKAPKFLVVNSDDQEAQKFKDQAPSAIQLEFSLAQAKPFDTTLAGSKLTIDSKEVKTALTGQFNVLNILGAAKMAKIFGATDDDIKKALANLGKIPGRMEKVFSDKPGQNFEVIVDYAHTTDSLAKAYETLGDRRKICVLGSCGGGRDKWKRPQMGKVASNHCDYIILTNEDPYDEDPEQIIAEVAEGITKPYVKILDRREAIRAAIKEAKEGDVVIITGKGTDPYIMGPSGKKMSWSDYEVAREEMSADLTQKLGEIGRQLGGWKKDLQAKTPRP